MTKEYEEISGPKMPRSAHGFFMEDFAQEIRERKIRRWDVWREAAKAWKNLSKEQMDVYVKKHEEAMKEYRSSEVYRKFVELKKLKKYATTDMKYEWEYSGYFMFIKKIFRQYSEDNVSEDLATEFASLWEQLGEEERERYRRKGAEARKRDTKRKLAKRKAKEERKKKKQSI